MHSASQIRGKTIALLAPVEREHHLRALKAGWPLQVPEYPAVYVSTPSQQIDSEQSTDEAVLWLLQLELSIYVRHAVEAESLVDRIAARCHDLVMGGELLKLVDSVRPDSFEKQIQMREQVEVMGDLSFVCSFWTRADNVREILQ